MNKYFCFSGINKGIIIAADVVSLDALRKLVKTSYSCDEIVAIKVGFQLALRYGLLAVVSAVRDICSLPIIYDHQKAATDIPTMGKAYAEVCAEAGVHGLIFFPQSGPKTLEAFVKAALDYDLIPIVGLVMTHPAYLQSEGGFIADDSPDNICRMALDMGVGSFVLPGTKTEIVEKYGKGLLLSQQPTEIMMPGIGSQGGTVSAAFKAAEGHHPFAIIGSAIYKAPNPKAAVDQFASEVRG